jgi:hypothetical protein
MPHGNRRQRRRPAPLHPLFDPTRTEQLIQVVDGHRYAAFLIEGEEIAVSTLAGADHSAALRPGRILLVAERSTPLYAVAWRLRMLGGPARVPAGPYLTGRAAVALRSVAAMRWGAAWPWPEGATYYGSVWTDADGLVIGEADA